MIRLVSGSRSLVGVAEAWAFEILRRVFKPEDVLVTGYAAGPDKWALQVAEEMGIPWYSYQPSGLIVTPDKSWEWCTGRGPKPSSGDDRGVWKRWFLLRDEVMVEHMGKFRDRGRDVEVLGLVDPTSRTKGTDYTLEKARKIGLTVERLVFTQG